VFAFTTGFLIDWFGAVRLLPIFMFPLALACLCAWRVEQVWGIFIFMGFLVFMMKPWHGPSWAFLVMTLILGICLTYFWPSYVYSPSWLDNIFLFLAWFFPASVLHLTVLFPERRKYFSEKSSSELLESKGMILGKLQEMELALSDMEKKLEQAKAAPPPVIKPAPAKVQEIQKKD